MEIKQRATLYRNSIVFILIMHKYWLHFLVILIAASFLMFPLQSVHGCDPHFHLCCQPGQFLAGAYHSHHPLCHFHSLPHGHHPLHPRPVLSGSGLSQPRPAHPAEGPAEHPGHHERALQRPGRWEPNLELTRRQNKNINNASLFLGSLWDHINTRAFKYPEKAWELVFSPAVDLTSVLTPDVMAPILANPEVQQRLMPYLPSGESLPQSSEELSNTLSSPQFQQVHLTTSIMRVIRSF